LKKSFVGRKTDWSKKHSTSKFLGKQGEDLVIRHERKKLKALGLIEKAELIQKEQHEWFKVNLEKMDRFFRPKINTI